jgi:hypothetical protein
VDYLTILDIRTKEKRKMMAKKIAMKTMKMNWMRVIV